MLFDLCGGQQVIIALNDFSSDFVRDRSLKHDNSVRPYIRGQVRNRRCHRRVDGQLDFVRKIMRKRERLLVPEFIWVNRPKVEGQSPFVEYLDGWRL